MKFEVPGHALEYIVQHYFIEQQVEGVPASVGISQNTAEKVVELFVDWATKKGYIKDGVLLLEQMISD